MHCTRFDLVCLPGTEPWLMDEARSLSLAVSGRERGLIEVGGNWQDVARANICLRGASAVLVHLGAFPATDFRALEQGLSRLDWRSLLPAGKPLRVDVSTRRSALYHTGAIAQRVHQGSATQPPDKRDESDTLRVIVRLENDRCTVKLDTSGTPLHQRGFKQAVHKAPLRETMAALLLRACDYQPGEGLLDPMCGSGTFLLEAADMAFGLPPGRARHFAFERLGVVDPDLVHNLRQPSPNAVPAPALIGFDRDPQAIAASRANAERAGMLAHLRLGVRDIRQLVAPDGVPPGLLLVNPPYGARLGQTASLRSLYEMLGRRIRGHFRGWRLGLVTSDETLARATGLDLRAGAPLAHGALQVRLYQASID